jgi:hypothetical protein
MFSYAPPCLRMNAATVALVLAFTHTPLAGTDSSSSPFPGLSRSIQRVWIGSTARPDVDVSEDTKIRIGEPPVEFNKNSNPRNHGTYGLSAAQLKKNPQRSR